MNDDLESAGALGDVGEAEQHAAALTERLLDDAKMQSLRQAQHRAPELLAALDDMADSIHAGDTQRAFFCIFVWGQNRERILSGEETWEDQRIPPIVFGGGTPVNERRP